ncbi:hypothetical protein GQ53DRAFT_854612 [Thozetella sp. PMI_491]|nr:hypothetical protein GQ53DRAFT_854612 [Thozetella sp. PMI_491]
MKLVLGGSTGFVAAEVIRQGLENPAITSIVTLGRRENPASSQAGPAVTKLRSIICDDFESYPDSVKKELEGADACIWTIAITPSKFKTATLEEATKVSRDYAVAAIQTLDALHKKQDKPLRFIYMSGHFAPRSRAEVPPQLTNGDMIGLGLMRGEAESLILEYAQQSSGRVESCIVKPGLIDAPERPKRTIPGMPNIARTEIVAAMLDQIVHGFEKDTLSNSDMVRIGQKALAD